MGFHFSYFILWIITMVNAWGHGVNLWPQTCYMGNARIENTKRETGNHTMKNLIYTPKLTQKIAREYLRILGATLQRKVEYNEYVVRYKGQEYFANDLDDAIATGAVIAGTSESFAQAEKYLLDALDYAV